MPRPAVLDHDAALDLALELFWKHGYRDVSVDDIARETGMNRHALYGRYQSKYGLAVVLLERYCAEGTRRLHEILHGAGTPRQRLQKLLYLRDPDCADPFWRCMLDRGCFAMRLVSDMKEEHPQVAEIVSRRTSALTDEITAVVREGQDRCEFRRDLAADLLATMIVSAWIAAPVVSDAQRRAIALAALN